MIAASSFLILNKLTLVIFLNIIALADDYDAQFLYKNLVIWSNMSDEL